MNPLEKAVELLRSKNYTFVAVSSKAEMTSTQRGIKPLLEILDSRKNLHGFSVADKVIGKGAAFLYVLLNVHEIYADVISESALDVLKNHNIRITYKTLTEAIKNRSNTGLCPIETTVKNVNDAETALVLIREKLKQISV
ncbi:MAG: DUF1893 domain-containing protein [Oscillospiraceae bacterium]|nr:DUF1893 domain-containing protein [Oscillospiraceae bacterium]